MSSISLIGGKGAYSGSVEGWEAICQRASGRRAYNRKRQMIAAEKRIQAMHLWIECGGRYGSQKDIARQLRLSEATVSRYLKRLKAHRR